MSTLSNKPSAPEGEATASSLVQQKGRRRVERALMLVASLGTLLVIFLYADLINQWLKPEPINKSLVYGRWVEQEVAPYARDVFYLSEKGVVVGGATVATEFEFDGKSLQYQVGDEIYRYKFTTVQLNEIKRQSDQHYNPVFRLIR